ncbi:DNA primase [Helicobacter sp. T3_23-1056]
MISQASIQNLKTYIDIVEIIGSYIELMPDGSGFKALCPFHSEKTPSFKVSPQKGLYFCYGACGKGGDAITFVMEYEKLNYKEAIEKIAEMCGFTLEYDKKNEVKKTDVLEKMAQFYSQNLAKSTFHLDYLQKRGINENLINTFKLGYCPTSAQNLAYINANGLDFKELLEYGVLGKTQESNSYKNARTNSQSEAKAGFSTNARFGVNERMYARFSERVIFPIHSPNGKIIGFGGRTLNDEAVKEGKMGKYINSPQSVIFNKSKILYGYHLARSAIYKRKQVIIVEGYLDTIMLHKAGFINAVATLGTALTKEHIPLLDKGAPEILLGFDGDSAGINAAFKASKLLAPLSKKGGVVIFPNGADPADMVAQGREGELESIFAKSTPFIEFCFYHIVGKYDIGKNPLQKEDALKESSEFLHSLSPLMQEEYVGFLADLLHIPQRLINTKYDKSSLIKLQADKNASKNNADSAPLESSGDRLERLILRYMLENEALLNRALDFIDSRIFMDYRGAFEALCKEDKKHPQLLGIALDPLPLRSDDDGKGFEEELKYFIKRHLERELKLATDIALIMRLRAKLARLNKGELQTI